MKILIAFLITSISLGKTFCQVNLRFTYGTAADYKSEFILGTGKKLTITLSSKLSDADLAEFLSKSLVQKRGATEPHPAAVSLESLIKNLGAAGQGLIKDNVVKQLDLVALIGPLENTEQIVFIPFLGKGESDKPVTTKPISITVQKVSAIFKNPSNIRDFEDCFTCGANVGDLVYDFRCKQLYQVVDSGGQIGYEPVKNLKSIIVKDRHQVRMKLVGINRYLYNVTINVADSIYGSNAPPLFSQFFSGTGEVFEGLLKKGSEGFLQNEDLENDFLKLKGAIKIFRDAFNDLLDRQIVAYLYCLDPSIGCCTVENPLGNFSDYSNKLMEVIQWIGTVESKYLAGLSTSTDIISKINEKQTKLETCKNNEKQRLENIAAAKKEVSETGNDAAKKKAAEDKLKKLEEDGCDSTLLANYQSDIKTLKEKLPLRLVIESLKGALPTQEQLRRLYLFDRNIVKDHFIYLLPPIYPQGDELALTIDMDARDSAITAEMGFMPTYHDELNLSFSVRNKPLFSFSSGPFFVFGGDFPIQSFGFRRVPLSGTVIGNDARYVLDETGDGPLPIGLGAFAHIGKKYSSNFGVAGSIGVGYSFNQEAILPAFMGGITASFGGKQRLNLTFGAAGAQVRELKKELYLGSLFATQPVLEYNKPVRIGFFTSVSYSIFTSSTRINIFSKSKK